MDSITTKESQKQAEHFLADRAPARENILLANAALQRTSIKLANCIFSYSIIPTSLRSTTCLSEEDGRLLRSPAKINIVNTVQLTARARIINEIIQQHSRINSFVYAVPTDKELDDSPLCQIVSNPQTYPFFQKYFLDEIKSATIINSWVDYDEFCEKWFKSDHHWNIDGAYDGYVRAVSAMGFSESMANRKELIVYEQPSFYGSMARNNLYPDLSDNIMDYEFDTETDLLEITINADKSTVEDLAHKNMYATKNWDAHTFKDRYSEYFHGEYGEITIRNASADTNRTLLLVANSYSNCIERLFSKHYSTVLVYDARRNSESLSNYIELHPEIDDMLILSNLPGFLSAPFR